MQIVWVATGHGQEARRKFWRSLRLSRAKIEAVAMDLSAAYWAAAAENLPEAAVVFDRPVSLGTGTITLVRTDACSGTAIPVPSAQVRVWTTFQPGDTLRKLAFRWGVTINAILAANPQITNPSLIYVWQVINIPGSSAAPVYYTVQRGDTLQIIAARYGTSVYSLQMLNPQIRNPNWIFAGMVIRVK